MKVGLDIGSTTIKCVVFDQNNNIIYKTYNRHYSKIQEQIVKIIEYIKNKLLLNSNEVKLSISGSAGLGIANLCSIPFIQEVYATRKAASLFNPECDVIIELGGEDAKILFLKGNSEVRMNGSCAGGTGAFIDQMATLLNVTPDEMNKLSCEHQKTYTIASRCGVFAKSDVQPLLNQGARKTDISRSIFMSVVNQTIAGLAQGRKINGSVVYLGGPLTFLSELRDCFDKTLNIKGVCPENSLYYVSIGAAICADQEINLNFLLSKLKSSKIKEKFASRKPLFNNQEEYLNFKLRHSKATVKTLNIDSYKGKAYLGIDAGSTTVKTALIGENNELLDSSYQTNSGNPIPLIKEFLEHLYKNHPNVNICGATCTGYGEDLIKQAFHLDFGLVETIAHLTAAKYFIPDVDFIIDIGGQDIKCFKIKNGVIDNIFLNEACSSGCGSFLQTFSNALGYSVEQFSKLGLFAKSPVDLGSRCTVFMNSAVKQAQKDGATVADIAAGLSISIVKNALYKVIRASTPSDLGEKIVVQGGTFLNDSVLRAFELELGVQVTRLNISGLMGAYGAALYAKNKNIQQSSMVTPEQLANFKHNIKVANCGLCSNNCKLTINIFDSDRKYIGGNRCEKPVTKTSKNHELNIYQYKLELLDNYRDYTGFRNETISIPVVLNMYELLPFWFTFFKNLGFSIKTSVKSSRKIYLSGQHTIPSDTVCFPAKLSHGHIQQLIDTDAQVIFYPCMSYNFNEHISDNYYNCPVVAYYPEVIRANMKDLKNIKFINEYLALNNKKHFPAKAYKFLTKYFGNVNFDDVKKATKLAFREYYEFIGKIKHQGEYIITKARNEHKPIIVLAGRPYHIDPEINHGIDKLIESFGVAVLSEDSLPYIKDIKPKVLNQWTYHARLYSAAKFIKDQPDINLVQLVSFGCGVDAITTDEVREILENEKKIYTQIKIDEITNLGAVKIRLRSLLSALEYE